MTLKFSLAALRNRPGTVEKSSEVQTEEDEALQRERASAELETRFRESIASGKITGDVISLDEQGNVVRSSKSTNIFDL